jgi:hypothetical protein
MGRRSTGRRSASLDPRDSREPSREVTERLRGPRSAEAIAGSRKSSHGTGHRRVAAEAVGVDRSPHVRIHSPVEQPLSDLQLVEVLIRKSTVDALCLRQPRGGRGPIRYGCCRAMALRRIRHTRRQRCDIGFPLTTTFSHHAPRSCSARPEPSRGLPTVAHVRVTRERRLARPAGLEPATLGLEGRG